MAPDRIEKHLKHVGEMAEELRKLPRPKPNVPTEWNGKPVESLTPEERKDFIFSMQPKSTQDAITRQKTRSPEEDNDWLLRPMPDCLANPEAKTLDELTTKRPVDPSDVLLHNSAKSNRNTWGESKASSVTNERRTAGVEAFTYSKPANPSDKDLRRLMSLNEIDAVVASEPPKPVPKKRPWWKFWEKEKEETGDSTGNWGELLRQIDERKKWKSDDPN